MTFASSSTCFKNSSKSTQNHSNKHTLSLNTVRLHCAHCNTRNRSEITYYSEFIEHADGTNMLEHSCCECTKNYWACEKFSQTVTHRHITRRDTNRHRGRCQTMKISADESGTKSEQDIDLFLIIIIISVI